jgi:hypothetical protein
MGRFSRFACSLRRIGFRARFPILICVSIGLVWWHWPWAPDEVRSPPDVGWLSKPDGVVFWPDGKWAVTVRGQTVSWWDLSNGALLNRFQLSHSPLKGGYTIYPYFLHVYNDASGNAAIGDLKTGKRVLADAIIQSFPVPTARGWLAKVQRDGRGAGVVRARAPLALAAGAASGG